MLSTTVLVLNLVFSFDRYDTLARQKILRQLALSNELEHLACLF